MLMPKRTKYRRVHRGRMKGKATRGNKLSSGEYGLVALEPSWITSNQIEAARIAMTRYIKRGGNVWIKIFPDKPVTKKPAETRMGSGKGAPEYWVAVVKPGRIMFEMAGIPEESAREAMRLAMHKLPIKCKFVTKADWMCIRDRFTVYGSGYLLFFRECDVLGNPVRNFCFADRIDCFFSVFFAGFAGTGRFSFPCL